MKTKITTKHMCSRPSGADQWFVESGDRGEGALVGRVTPSGARRFYFRYSSPDGSQVRLPIGHFDEKGEAGGMTVAAARDAALKLAKLYQQHRDLRNYLQEQRAEALRADAQARERASAEKFAAELAASRRLSVRELFKKWAEVDLVSRKLPDGRRAGRKDGGRSACEGFERRVFNVIGDVAAAEVSKADIRAILDGVISEGKRRTANVLLADVKQMFRFAVDREIVSLSPVEAISKKTVGGSDVARDRVLTNDQIRMLSIRVKQSTLSDRSATAIWLILSTACRVGELMDAKWSDINWKARTWHLPITKNQREHTIHLSDFALEHLRRLAENCQGKWLFMNTTGDGPLDRKTFGKQLADRQREPTKRLKNRAMDTTSLCLPGGRWTAHDLRRTAATLMADLGVSGDVIDECLNHMIESRVRRTYVRDRREKAQALAFDQLGGRLAALIAGHMAGESDTGRRPRLRPYRFRRLRAGVMAPRATRERPKQASAINCAVPASRGVAE